MSTSNELFLDAAYLIALAVERDQHHERAMALRDQLKLSPKRLVTTRAVALEVGDALAKARYRPAAVQLLRAFSRDPNVEVVPISEELYERAFQLYQERRDKEWGITDCVSFIVMQDRGLTSALTTDEHYQQAGFRALLREA
jgi:predicted nucleic acid-binding protein